MTTLVAANGAGFSNRVKNIVSSMRMSEDVEVLWRSSLFPAHNLTKTSLTDFFVNLKETDTTQGKRIRNCWRYEVFETDQIPEGFSNDIEAKCLAQLGPVKPAQHPKGINIDWAYNSTPDYVKSEYLKQFAKLEINPQVLQSVDDFGTTDYVSVHVRRWERGCGRQRLFSLDKYVELMQGHDSKFFVATDTPSIIRELQGVFGEDRILHRIPTGSPSDLFVEQLLLSKGSAMIGTPWSSFTEVAWWFSGCNIDVELAWT